MLYSVLPIVSKTTRELLLEWNKGNAVELSSDLRLPQFSVDKVVTGHCENETSIIGKLGNHDENSLMHH